MNITSHNYETFFMLYADNELDAAARQEVEAFIAVNPQLEEELAILQSFKLQPDEAVVFTGKQALLRQEATGNTITIYNYSSFFVLYADDELDNAVKIEVENFVQQHPHTKASFEYIQQARVIPDASLVFANKTILYRHEKDDRVIPIAWWRVAAAAIVLLLAGALWLYQSKKDLPGPIVRKAGPTIQQQENGLPKAPVAPGNGNTEQLQKQAVATLDVLKQQRAAKKSPQKMPVLHNQLVSNKKQPEKEPVSIHAVQEPEQLAVNRLQPAQVTVGKGSMERVDITKSIAAAKQVTDQPLTILQPEEDNAVKADWASSAGNDKVEVLNTAVNTKNSMRGFLRKASRLISKKASLADGDSNRKGILIGGFEIAVR